MLQSSTLSANHLVHTRGAQRAKRTNEQQLSYLSGWLFRPHLCLIHNQRQFNHIFFFFFFLLLPSSFYHPTWITMSTRRRRRRRRQTGTWTAAVNENNLFDFILASGSSSRQFPHFSLSLPSSWSTSTGTSSMHFCGGAAVETAPVPCILHLPITAAAAACSRLTSSSFRDTKPAPLFYSLWVGRYR